MKLQFLIFIAFFSLSSLYGQCDTWLDSPRKDEAENAHVIYRQNIKSKNYEEAFKHWKVAYEIAPAADGKRDHHFKDGVEIYSHFYENATDPAKKEEYKEKVLNMYDHWINCIGEEAISFKGCIDRQCIEMKQGTVMGKKGIDMFTVFQMPRMEVYEFMKKGMALSGWETDYLVLRPYAQIVVGLVTKSELPAENARAAHQLLNEIADYNIENDETMAQYYEYEKRAMNQIFSGIEKQIYDCQYFIDKYQPQYEETPDNIELLKEIVVTLKQQDCPADNPFLVQLESQYSKYASEYNAQQQAEFEKKNPSVAAKRLYDQGKYAEAVEKYKEAIRIEEDKEKQASFYFSLASIQYRKLDQYSAARESARKAASLRDNWGRPYMLIGDMYAKSSRTCGNDAYTRGLAVIAAIDKWAQARSVDSEVAAEANRNIAKFSQYMPPKDDAFMQGKNEGELVSVDCWIGETVKLRFN